MKRTVAALTILLCVRQAQAQEPKPTSCARPSRTGRRSSTRASSGSTARRVCSTSGTTTRTDNCNESLLCLLRQDGEGGLPVQLPLKHQGRPLHGVAPERKTQVHGSLHPRLVGWRGHRLLRERAERIGGAQAERPAARPGQVLVREWGPAVRVDVRSRDEPASPERQLSIPVVPPQRLRGGRIQEVAARHIPARRFGPRNRSEEAVLIWDPQSGVPGTGVPLRHARPAVPRAPQVVDR